MTDIPGNAPPNASGNGAQLTGAPEGPPPNLRVLAQFTRDLSFENPLAPDSLRAGAQPAIDLGVEMNARGRQDGLYEVDLKLSATAARDDKVVFQVELLYGGLFEVTGVPQEHIEPVLLIECPRYLFPFARRIIADATAEGGFPPFMLEPIDFGAVYAAQQLERQKLAEGSAAGSA
jgi:preprotein translocase subunit SecB